MSVLQRTVGSLLSRAATFSSSAAPAASAFGHCGFFSTSRDEGALHISKCTLAHHFCTT